MGSRRHFTTQPRGATGGSKRRRRHYSRVFCTAPRTIFQSPRTRCRRVLLAMSVFAGCHLVSAEPELAVMLNPARKCRLYDWQRHEQPRH
jgi:hypothetical protein